MTDVLDVQAANRAFYRAFEKKNMEAMAAIWSQGTGSLCIHPGRNALQGWSQIQASWEQIFKATQYLEIETELISMDVKGDLAYVVVIESLLQVARGQRLESKTVATNVFERMAQKWYVVHHHGSPLLR